MTSVNIRADGMIEPAPDALGERASSPGHDPTSYRLGIRWAVTWLHDRAKKMNDPHAAHVLNSAAVNLGVDVKTTVERAPFEQYASSDLWRLKRTVPAREWVSQPATAPSPADRADQIARTVVSYDDMRNLDYWEEQVSKVAAALRAYAAEDGTSPAPSPVAGMETTENVRATYRDLPPASIMGRLVRDIDHLAAEIARLTTELAVADGLYESVLRLYDETRADAAKAREEERERIVHWFQAQTWWTYDLDRDRAVAAIRAGKTS